MVAGEVRTLAQRSADAAKEIKMLIEESGDRISHGEALVNQAGEALESIEVSIKKVNDVASEISAAGQEQTSGIDQVNLAVSELDSVNQQNAALVEEAAAASATLSEQADGLTDLVAFFKLNSEMDGHTNKMTNFADLFTRAKSAHLAWKEKVKGIVEGRLSVDGENILTCKECELGNWISVEGVQQYGKLEEMEPLGRVHQEMHDTIEEILTFKRQGNQSACEASYRKIEPLSTQVVQYLNALEKKMSEFSGKATNQQRSTPKRVATPVAVAPKRRVQRPVAVTADSGSEWAEF